MLRRTLLWLLPLSVLALLLGVRYGREYLRRDAPDCLPSESAQSCYRRGVGFAAEALDRRLALPDRDRLRALAVGLMHESCRREHSPACYGLARQLLIGQPGDLAVRTRAANLYERACGARPPSPAACNGLGEAYAYALGRPHDERQALFWFEKACDLGYATACYRASRRIRDSAELGRWGAERADRLLRTACEDGSMTACLDQASRLEGTLPHTPERDGREAYERGSAFAVATYTRACDARFFLGCHHLGRLYEAGALGLPRHPARARALYEGACFTKESIRDYGRSMSCKALGDLLDRQKTPAARVDSLYRAACDMLAPEGCVALASLRARTARGAALTPLAVLSVTACVQGSPEGCRHAAELYARPDFRNPEAEQRYRRRACGLGHVAECLALAGDSLFAGSAAWMHKYYARACALPGGAGACAWLDQQAEIRNAGLGCQEADAGPDCPRPVERRTRVVGMGSVPGALAPGDGVLDDGSYYDEWVVRVERQRPLRVAVCAPGFDASVSVGEFRGGRFRPDWSNDDAAEDVTHAAVTLVPPRGGDLVVRVNTFGPAQAGDYVMTVEPAPVINDPVKTSSCTL